MLAPHGGGGMNEKTIALPCRFIVITPDRYHECGLAGGCCVFPIGDLLVEPTIIYSAKPSGLSISGNPDEGTLDVAVTGYELDIENPKVIPNERPGLTYDTLCPAGYTWKQVKEKFDAAWELCPEQPWKIDEKNCERINAQIRELFKNIPMSDIAKKYLDVRLEREAKEARTLRSCANCGCTEYQIEEHKTFDGHKFCFVTFEILTCDYCEYDMGGDYVETEIPKTAKSLREALK